MRLEKKLPIVFCSFILQFYKHAIDQYENDLLSVVQSYLLSIKETDLRTDRDGQCNGSCIHQSLVKLLKLSGYDAAVCYSKWQGFDNVPGGMPLYRLFYLCI